ncbi:DNRLRE domain-containing protein [Dyadobacter flavalbus]|uniref:DNRLRE domain-containing protein n=1 Tax=Dyadobacter flavalbus TaxID=2579942 RepID=A0A5M8QQP0_9BACT|nr:malectin domain-containing carbohydrate-binding protein [Dyadobacter flavalbus]KAA6438389.1 DNRLRE domain-containing protein [Dyadobacter flavalbus]
MQKTTDGGYILGLSSDGDKSSTKSEDNIGGYGDYDYWVVKLSVDGNVEWDNTIGGINNERLVNIQQTSDGGYILGGWSVSGISGDKSEASKGNSDYWIVKLNQRGTAEWNKTIGGSGYDDYGLILNASDGGYIIAGNSDSPVSGNKTKDAVGYWVVKVSVNGQVEWDQVLTGGTFLNSFINTLDGGYILGGYAKGAAFGDRSQGTQGDFDMWIIKISANGTKIWDKTIGGSSTDMLPTILQTPDGGYLLGGTSNSNVSGEKTESSKGEYDYWIVKLAPENPTLPSTPIRINAGGPAFTTATKKLFIADKYYAGIDRVSSIATSDITNTSNDILYQSARCSPSFSYNIPVPNGEVSVYLHFAETYFGAPGKKGGKGSRQFHVNMEGVRKLTNYDIFAKAGGAMLATAETFTVNVTDGMLNIDFLSGAADLPRVSAIEVLPSPQRTLTFTPEADATVRNGIYQNQNFGSDPLLGTKSFIGSPRDSRDLERVSYLKFAIPGITNVKSAKLRVYGNNHENMQGITLVAGGVLDDSWTENGITKANAPSYLNPATETRVQVNSELKYRDLDVTEFVRSQASGDKVVSLAMATRSMRLLNFHSKENPSGFAPQLVIVTDNTINQVTRLGNEIEAEPKAEDALSSVIYPNPAKDHIMLEISSAHKSEVDLELTNLAGSRFRLQCPEIEANSSRLKVGLPGQLPAGMYLLKVRSKEFSEVLKVLVTE